MGLVWCFLFVSAIWIDEDILWSTPLAGCCHGVESMIQHFFLSLCAGVREDESPTGSGQLF